MSATLRPDGLSIDYGGDQFPVTGATPRLSWKPDGNSVDGWVVEALVDDVPVEPVTLGRTAFRFSPWPWAPLTSRSRVRWRVRAAGCEDRAAWSAWHRFEVGLLDADWTARWISPVVGADPGSGHRPASRLWTDLDIPGEPARARLYATALGVYEALVNGRRVGTTELAPGATSYDLTLYAQAHDVTDALRSGRNRLDVVLSDGWYRSQVGAFRIPAGWGTTLAARAELHVDLADGSTVIVRTGPDWLSSPSTITRADLMDGQTTDFTLSPAPGVPVLIDHIEAPAVDWSPAPPVRVVDTIPPIGVTSVDADTLVADFGQNASGWVSLDDLGPAGTCTTIDYGEYVGPDGDLDTSHLDSVSPTGESIRFVQHDEVVSAGDAQVFEPRHTVHGFRYARVRRPGGLATLDGLTMRVVHTDLETTGTFACSDPDLTRLYEVARWSFRGNAVDIPTDCPTRERLGWTGDYQVFVSTAARLYDVLGFSRKWLRSVRDDQLADGRIANFSPDGRRIKHHLDDRLAMMTGSAGWGDAIVHVPWELYRAYGDVLVLDENYEAMVRWVEWALSTARTSRHGSRIARSAEPLPHEKYVWDGSFHWGEWCEPKPRAADGTLVDPVQSDPRAWFMADKGDVGTSFLYRSTSTLARIARALGRDADADRYDDVARHVAEAWRTEFLAPEGHVTPDTQAAHVRALAFGLVPDGLRPDVSARLVELVEAAGTHLATGFLSTADLLPVLAGTGHADVAYHLLFQRTSPSWLGMLDRGATTIWEDWDGIDERGVAHDSLNHYSKGAVVRFLHTHTLGLQQQEDSAGWESFLVAPVPHPQIQWASGSLKTPVGTIMVDWRVVEAVLEVTVDVPPVSAGVLRFPDGECLPLPPGRSSHRGRLAD